MVEWLRTDEAEEAVGALEAAARFIGELQTDLFAWRWAILSLHIAAQGFMVVALRDSAGLLPLRDEVAAEWLEAHRAGTPPPAEKLDEFLNLYKKVKRKEIATLLQATPFEPKDSQGRSIKMLNRLRNQFVHFLPMTWSLETAGLPEMCLDVLDFIEFLSASYRPHLWRGQAHPKRIATALAAARAVLGARPT